MERAPLSQLPRWVQERIAALRVADAEQWIRKPIPALGNRAVAEIVGSPDGEELLREYFAKVNGRF